MKKMVMNHESRYLFKNKIILMFLALCMITPVYYIVSQMRYDVDGYYVFTSYVRVRHFYVCLAFAAVGYYCFAAASENHCAEVADAIRRKRYVWNRRIISAVLGVVAFYNVVCIVMFIICSLEKDGTSYFISYFWWDFICNIFLPMLVFIGMAYLAAQVSRFSQVRALSMMIIFFLLCSSLKEQVVWQKKPEGFPIDRVLQVVFTPFYLFYSGNWETDSQYGAQGDWGRIFWQLFWLVLFVMTAFYLHIRENGKTEGKKRLHNGLVLGAGAVCTVALFVGACIPESRYRLEESWNGVFQDARMTYFDVAYERGMGNVETDFTVTSYDLEIDIERRLNVDGTLHVRAKEGTCQELVFTLYRDYKVKELTADVPCTWWQEDDLVYCTFETPISETDVQIRYGGFSKRFYSSARGIMLPGFFPWYPMAGECPVSVHYNEYLAGQGYFPYNRVDEAKFTVSLAARCESISNLELVSESGWRKEYEGTGDSLTLLGGKLVRVEDSEVQDVLPLSFFQGADVETDVAVKEQMWKDMVDTVENRFGIDTGNATGKKLIFGSQDLSRNSVNNGIVEFEDYVLAAQDEFYLGTYLHYILTEHERVSPLLLIFDGAVCMMCEYTSAEFVTDSLLMEAQNYNYVQEIQKGDNAVLFDNVPLEAAVEHIDGETLIHEITWYLLEQDKLETDEAFFDYLEEKYGYEVEAELAGREDE